MQLARPSEPARAVSTAIRTLRKETHPFPPFREGVAEPDETMLLVCEVIVFLVLEVNG